MTTYPRCKRSQDTSKQIMTENEYQLCCTYDDCRYIWYMEKIKENDRINYEKEIYNLQ